MTALVGRAPDAGAARRDPARTRIPHPPVPPMDGVRFGTTIAYGDPRWRRRAVQVAPSHDRRVPWWVEALQFLRVVAAVVVRRVPVLVLNSQSGRLHPDLLAAIVARAVPWRPRIVVQGAMWQRDDGRAGRLQRTLVRAADPAVDRWAVMSTDELALFCATWGVGWGKVRFHPYFFTIQPEWWPTSHAPGVGVFAGGDSVRDYDVLVDAARRLPDVPFTFATSLLDDRTDLPPNVTAGRMAEDDYFAAMRDAACVAVALRTPLSRSTGHQTYLNAMWFGRPTLVTDAPGVADHVVHGRTGLVVGPGADAWTTALRQVLDASPAAVATARAMGDAAHADVARRFRFEDHVTALLGIVDDAAADGDA